MSAQLPARDLERISAYLDNALVSKERESLEARLQTEPKLAQTLAEMEHLRALLGRAPQRRVPRSFVLRQSDLPERPMSGWTSLNLVSAVATLMLVLVFAGDIWANGLPLIGAPAPETFPQVMMAEAPTETPGPLGGGSPEVTATPAPEGEIELFSVPAEDAGREDKQAAPFDLRFFMAEYARPLETGFFIVAIGAGLAAWWRRRKI